MNWYGVRSFYLWHEIGAYEERVTVWRAASFDDALAKAEEEAREYQPDKVELLGLLQAFDTGFDDDDVNGMEMFSLVRRSDLPPQEYIDTYFSTGGEYQKNV